MASVAKLSKSDKRLKHSKLMVSDSEEYPFMSGWFYVCDISSETAEATLTSFDQQGRNYSEVPNCSTGRKDLLKVISVQGPFFTSNQNRY